MCALARAPHLARVQVQQAVQGGVSHNVHVRAVCAVSGGTCKGLRIGGSTTVCEQLGNWGPPHPAAAPPPPSPRLTRWQPYLLGLIAASVVLEVFHKLAAPRLDNLARATSTRPGRKQQTSCGHAASNRGECAALALEWRLARWRPCAAMHALIPHFMVMTASSNILCASLTSAPVASPVLARLDLTPAGAARHLMLLAAL